MKRKKPLSLTSKLLISLGILTAGTGVVIGSMFGYSANSDEVLGSKSPIDSKLLINDFSKFRSGKTTSTLDVKDNQGNVVAKSSNDGSKFYYLDDKSKTYTLKEFQTNYLTKYNQDFASLDYRVNNDKVDIYHNNNLVGQTDLNYQSFYLVNNKTKLNFLEFLQNLLKDKKDTPHNVSIIEHLGQLVPELEIYDPQKSKVIASTNQEGTEFWFISEPKVKYNFDDFYQEYFKRYKESFNLNIKYGSFIFADEYVLAVRPKQFIEFSKWFMNNVAWGPDVITLNVFRIVSGVTRNGNSITLGDHSTLHKESSEIKFYPDAFFGTLPIYSSISGRGNATDALTYSAFKDVASYQQVTQYLKDIPLASIVKNNYTRSVDKDANVTIRNKPDYKDVFANIIMPGRLLNQKVKLFVGQDYDPKYSLPLPKQIDRNNTKPQLPTEQKKTLFLNSKITADQFNQIKNAHLNDFKDIEFNQLKDATITKVEISQLEYNNPEGNKIPHMIISFTYKDQNNQDVNGQYVLQDLKSLNSFVEVVSLQQLEQVVNQQILNFLDFYDVNNYLDKNIYIYHDPTINQDRFFANYGQAYEYAKTPENAKSITKYQITNFEVQKTQFNNKNIFNLFVTLKDSNNQTYLVSFNNNLDDKANREQFTSFKDAVEYQGSIKPITMNVGPEKINTYDENGQLLTGIKSRDYQIYNEVYPGLIEKVTRDFPFLLKELNGPHIESVLNDQGFYEYQVVNGPYKGLDVNDSIGLPLVLYSFIDGFEGISTDFLKYVGTHEYGHHYTLQMLTQIGKENNSVYTGALSVRGGANDSGYLNVEYLKNYLKARTGIDIYKVNALDNETSTGEFFKYKFLTNKDGKKVWEKEADADVWGSVNRNASYYDTINQNPKRRFLQDFNGLAKAAELRGVKIGDLFLANSFDRHSGTINPYYDDKLKAFGTNPTTGQSIIAEVSAKDVYSTIKDGSGRSLIDAGVVTITDESKNEFTVSIVDAKTNDQEKLIITKVKLLNNDGTPAIVVPLNTPLDEDSANYYEQKIKTIEDAIKNIYSNSVHESGWNNSATILGPDPAFSIINLLGAVDDQGTINSIKYRSDEIEKNPSYNLLGVELGGKMRKAYHYLALGGKSIIEDILLTLYNSEAIQAQGEDNATAKTVEAGLGDLPRLWKQSSVSYNIQTGYTVPRFAQINRVVKIGNNEYIMPRLQSSTLLNESIYGNNLSRLRDLAKQYDLVAPEGAIQLGFDDLLSLLMRTGILQFAYDDNQVSGLTLAKPLTNLVFNLDTNNSRFTILNKDAKSQSLGASIVALNPNATSAQMWFSSLDAFLTFSAMDYSKAKLDQAASNAKENNFIFNWDIDYVKTKFNLETFKAQLMKENDPNNQAIIANEQLLANEAMKRFRESGLMLFVKNFNPLTQMEQNAAFLSKDYGVYFENQNIYRSYVPSDAYLDFNDGKRVSPNAIQRAIASFLEKNNLKDYGANVDAQDLLLFLGGIITWKDLGYKAKGFYSDFVYSQFSTGTPSNDASTYFATRVEPLLNDKFTDYIYTIAETLTRDYVQTTFVPIDNFGNSPKYLKDINEGQTGLEYIVDVTSLEFLNSIKLSSEKFNEAFSWVSDVRKNKAIRALNLKVWEETLNKEDDLDNKIQKLTNEKTVLDAKFKNNELNLKERFKLKDIQKELEEARSDRLNLIKERLNQYEKNEQQADKTLILFNKNNLSSSSRETRESSYFGKLLKHQNGYFVDRAQKAKIKMELYDDNRNPVIIPEDERRLTSFDGKTLVDNQPEAFFVSQLLNYGVGNRTISGINRNKDYDAVTLYGFASLDLLKQAKFLKFTNINNPKDIAYLPIHSKNTNNIFYLTRQGDGTTKKYLSEYGYGSWISDYAYMSKYRDKLLDPQQQYYVEFADKDKKVVGNFTLGSEDVIGENGKLASQAPIKIYAEKKNNTKTGKAILGINYQFNNIG
ncbi:PDxFFG protein [Mycoplasma sp. NEAQ87857]|uniref:PDxFFG protein n=1 Tax=Mycoplasma sp. NEAQ87857 TaxID=2683967 RepID=UPI001318BDA4|nr:PDxFFG protein [Mycoplasma sp. NEAQ87857]QGZ97497.1 PDxFFG protein [Mycoplasma sp. NEAQ87857]